MALVLASSFTVALLLVLTNPLHGHLTHDQPGAVQKFHHHPTPRVGGVAIYVGLVSAWLAGPRSAVADILGIVLLAGLPALLFGLLEDVTKRVGVLPRLLATMFSGALACLLTGVALTRLDVPVIDGWLAIGPIAVLFTAFAVGGVANAINIMDGFHGLASGLATIALAAIASVAIAVGDAALAQVALLATAAVVGFWLVNYPWGKIFLGDGGAYFTGFALAWLAVLLPMRNPGVSPWASLLICGLPFIEVIYSAVRRVASRQSPGAPDRLHLHSLIATRWVHVRFSHWSPNAQNAAVAPCLWAAALVLAGLAWLFRHSTVTLFAGLALTALFYHWAYVHLVRGLDEAEADNVLSELSPTAFARLKKSSEPAQSP
jgi:UDP-N-acetylmuramyl pentapeptide phosphotransferase/UDP-N-acetylglucosamine-1-phosphate transferase